MGTPFEMVRVIREDYGLTDPKVLRAMLQVPREKFTPHELRHLAYDDSPISIGYGQTISQPYTVAFMTHLLDLQGSEKVLEIGTGSGYQTAVLSLLSKEVYSVERISELSIEAGKKLRQLGFKNVHVKVGQGEEGWKDKSQYDGIIITAGIFGKVPEELFDQLKVGGVLVAPIAEGPDKVMTKFIKKRGGKIHKEEHGIFHFVPFVESD